MPPNEDAALDPRDYLLVIRRRKWVIVVTVLVAVAAALGISFAETPQYRASAELLVRGSAAPTIDGNGDDEPERTIQNELQFLESDTVVAAATEELGAPPEVSIGASADSDVLVVGATDPHADRAALVANTYAETYLDQRQQAAVAAYDETATSIDAELTQNRAELAQHQTDLNAVTFGLQGDPTNAVALQQQQQLQGQIDQLNLRIGDLQDTLSQLRLDRALVGSGGAEISKRAEAPTVPSSPRTLRNAVIALFLGLVLGIGLAFLVEYLDNSVKTKADLEQVTGGLTVLGLIPHVAEGRKGNAEVVTVAEPSSPAAEAYRSLRVALQFSGLDKPIGVLMVTSASSSVGKTTTAANLAVAVARSGQRVIVVDADLRRPRLHEFFDRPVTPGFTSVLLGDKLDDCIQMVPGVKSLALLAAGPPPPDPAEVLGSAPVAAMIDDLRGKADLVIIDTPPAVLVADALAISRYVDATLVVALAGTSTKRDMARAVEVLDQVQAPVVGTALLGVDAAAGYQYGYAPLDR